MHKYLSVLLFLFSSLAFAANTTATNKKNCNEIKYEQAILGRIGSGLANGNTAVNVQPSNSKKDYVAFNKIATRLRALIKKGGCATATEDEQSILISYPKDSLAKEDFFSFDEDQKVVSWVRTDSAGKSISWNYDIQ